LRVQTSSVGIATTLFAITQTHAGLPEMSAHIDYYFSFPSPWAYIGHAAFEDIARAHRCTVTYKPVQLGDLFAETGGLPLAKRHPVRQRYRLIELQRWREKRGLKFSLHPKHWPFDPKRSDGMALAVIEAGLNAEPFMRAGFKSIWEQERNLDEPATLIELADSVGLPGKKLLERAASPEIADAYERNRQDAIAVGVFGSPGFVLNGEPFWGQDRIELLADALKSGRGPYRSDV
jgi:2-hydroxychromene-2-carboxylate isomerase